MSKTKSKPEIDQKAVELTALGIREVLMEYFKGTCIQRMVDRRHIELKRLPMRDRHGQRNYQYERRAHELHKPCVLRLYGTPLGECYSEPDSMTFYTKVMQRSPEFIELHNELRRFFKRYLGGVRVKTDDDKLAGLAKDNKDDENLIKLASVVELKQSGDYIQDAAMAQLEEMVRSRFTYSHWSESEFGTTSISVDEATLRPLRELDVDF